MWLELLITIFIIFIVYLIQILYIIPKKLSKTYQREFEALGYKVLTISYNPLYAHILESFKKGQKQGDSLQVLKSYKNYDIVISNLFNKVIIEFCHQDFIKELYGVDQHYIYKKVTKFIDYISRLSGNGLVFSEDKEWHKKRSVLNSVLNFEFIKAQTETIAKICDESILKIESKHGINEKEKTTKYNILDLEVKIFSHVILTCFLGGGIKEQIEGVEVVEFLKKTADDATEAAYEIPTVIFGKKYMNSGLGPYGEINRRIAIYKAWALEFVKKRAQDIEKALDEDKSREKATNIIEALIMLKRKAKDPITEAITTEEEMFNEFTVFFFAATDTTSHFTQMMIYLITKNPLIEQKLRDEIQKFMPENDYSYENLKNFSYIDNIQKEITRMYGPAVLPFFRVATKDNILNGIKMRKGTYCCPVNLGMHYSEKYFINPNEFRPERWEKECNDIPPFVIGGFGGGARSCIGKQLALLQNKISIIKFYKRYSKIELGIENFKLEMKFLPCPENFESTMTISE